MNINSLRVRRSAIGIGIDYGYYVAVALVEEMAAGRDFDVAIRPHASRPPARRMLSPGHLADREASSSGCSSDVKFPGADWRCCFVLLLPST